LTQKTNTVNLVFFILGGSEMQRKLSVCAASAAALLVAYPAVAGPNLVVNGGFETGDFTGWTTDPVSYPMYLVNAPVEAGNWAAQIAGYSYGPDLLTQTIATTAGETYSLSFWVYQQNIGPQTFLDVTWDGVNVFSKTYLGSGDLPYQLYSAAVVGTGSDTLQFSSANDPGWTYVDNISVAAPEPSTWAMMLVGFAGLAFAGHRAHKQAAAAA
jgi:hypothetical protein